MFAIDVHYGDTGATAAAVAFSAWNAEVAEDSYLSVIENVSPYEPGNFFQRELPCILRLLEQVPQINSCIVIDGFVVLGAEQRPGLGFHLWQALGREVPIIGVAKTRFANTPDSAELLRGQSTRPLYISAVGIELDEAKKNIEHMHGRYRMPTLLTLVDNLARGICSHHKASRPDSDAWPTGSTSSLSSGN